MTKTDSASHTHNLAETDKAIAAEAKARTDADAALVAQLGAVNVSIAALGLAVEAHDARLDVLETPTPPVPPIPVPPAKTFTVPRGTKGYVAKAGDVIDGWTITGPGDALFDGSTIGIYVAVPNVTIRNCKISGLGFVGIFLDPGATNFTIEKNTISHVGYAGILTKGATNGKIIGNLVDHIGDHGHQTPDCNAYGIVPTMDYGGAPSADILIDGNTVTDVPLWHGLNTHGGLRLTFSNNIVRRCARAIFLTNAAEGGNEDAHDCVVIGNDLGEPKSDVPAGGTDSNCAITLYKSFNTVVDNNKTGTYLVPINNVGNTATFAHPPTGNHP